MTQCNESLSFDVKTFDERIRSQNDNSHEIYTHWDESSETFEEMGLHENLLRGIYGYGFTKPSKIQQKGIVPFVRGFDVIEQAQSGTGKTATFCTGVLQRIDHSNFNCQALLLAPTRELAQQIKSILTQLGLYLNTICHACVGGTQIAVDTKNIRSGLHVIVGTPGRIHDLISRGILNPKHICIFVLDEADLMLSRGFKDQIYDIYQALVLQHIQVGLFSATISPEALSITKKFMCKPVRILIDKETLSLENRTTLYQC